LVTLQHKGDEKSLKKIKRVQTGARMEKTLVKVLKALAEYLDLSLGDLLEGIALHAFEGKAPFTRQTLGHIARLKSVYGLTLTVKDSHRLTEESDAKR
jgi:predicted DNA-binding ribbon-helix-helix protein